MTYKILRGFVSQYTAVIKGMNTVPLSHNLNNFLHIIKYSVSKFSEIEIHILSSMGKLIPVCVPEDQHFYSRVDNTK